MAKTPPNAKLTALVDREWIMEQHFTQDNTSRVHYWDCNECGRRWFQDMSAYEHYLARHAVPTLVEAARMVFTVIEYDTAEERDHALHVIAEKTRAALAELGVKP